MIEIYDATDEEEDYINEKLVHFNNTKVPFKQKHPFLVISRCIKECDEIVGGITANIYCWNILYIDVMWVKEDFRNKGYASALLRDVEKSAVDKNCEISHLDTFDWQAKEFYEKMGYTIFGVLEDCPKGHKRYYMTKKLK
ncbi:MAG: GNAT family N-acetyltransferase [Vagococcus sp.]|nr:GNAT family N-acetyltransferase [Vagococcus sp.]